MGDQPIWERIGRDFVEHYYRAFDTNRSQLASLYFEGSCLSWEGQQIQGKNAIVEKLNGLPFGKIVHTMSTEDHQPTPDGCILSMVVGQLKVDDDPIIGFHQIFLLKCINEAWFCTNEVFRLGLHNFG